MAPILKSEHIPNMTSGQSATMIALESRYLFLNGPTGLTYETTLASNWSPTRATRRSRC